VVEAVSVREEVEILYTYASNLVKSTLKLGTPMSLCTNTHNSIQL